MEDLLGIQDLPSLGEMVTYASITGSLPTLRFGGAGYTGGGQGHRASMMMTEELGESAILKCQNGNLRRMHVSIELRKEEKQQDWDLVMERAGLLEEGGEGEQVGGEKGRG